MDVPPEAGFVAGRGTETDAGVYGANAGVARSPKGEGGDQSETETGIALRWRRERSAKARSSLGVPPSAMQAIAPTPTTRVPRASPCDTGAYKHQPCAPSPAAAKATTFCGYRGITVGSPTLTSCLWQTYAWCMPRSSLIASPILAFLLLSGGCGNQSNGSHGIGGGVGRGHDERRWRRCSASDQYRRSEWGTFAQAGRPAPPELVELAVEAALLGRRSECRSRRIWNRRNRGTDWWRPWQRRRLWQWRLGCGRKRGQRRGRWFTFRRRFRLREAWAVQGAPGAAAGNLGNWRRAGGGMADAAHVRLLSGSPFYDRQQLHRTGYVASLDTDKLLFPYRSLAKLPQANGTKPATRDGIPVFSWGT